MTLLYASFFPVWFFLTLYVQEVLHFDAIQAGLSFLPMTGSIFVASTLAPKLVARLRPARGDHGRHAARDARDRCCSSASRRAAPTSASVFPGALLSAIGMGFSLVPATIVAMQSLPPEQSGIGSGLLNTSRLMGGALGLAVLSTIADAQTRARRRLRARARAHERLRPRVRRRRRDLARRSRARGTAPAQPHARRRRGAARAGDARRDRGGRGAGRLAAACR